MKDSKMLVSQTSENFEPDQSQDLAEAELALWRIMSGAQIAQALHTAVHLNIADLLISGPLSAEELAQKANAHTLSLSRLLRTLSSIGVFWEDEQQRFYLTSMSQMLRSDVPNSLSPLILLCHSPSHWNAWAGFVRTIQTGENSLEHLYGMRYWDYLNERPEERELCQRALSGISGGEIEAVLAAYDFSPYQLIVDIAGGWGTLLTLILQKYPRAWGILFDLPLVIEQAVKQIQETEGGKRCNIEAGDMFVSVPKGGDLYIVKSVMHDWEDVQVLTILRNCREAMKPGAKLLLIESVLTPRNVPDIGKFVDLFLLAIIGGRERTEKEFRTLIEQAGLLVERITLIQDGFGLSIIECSRRPYDE